MTRSLLHDAENIYKAALASVDPARLVESHVSREGSRISAGGETYDLKDYEKVFMVAFGKSAFPMARSLAKILGGRLTKGIVISPGADRFPSAGVTFVRASHPSPDAGSVRAGKKVMSLAKAAGGKDLIFMLVSGGGSSLLALPAKGIPLKDKRAVGDRLIKAGADIQQLNTVRKHISGIKGGRLAKAAYPASIVSLVISDVIGDDLGTIASGPAHWDPTTFKSARRVLKKFGIWETCPPAVAEYIAKGVRGEASETPKKDDPWFLNVRTHIIGDNKTALDSAEKAARQAGFQTMRLASADSGEARVAAKDYIREFRRLLGDPAIHKAPTCMLAGGELTVRVRGRGKGGRNTEFVLAALNEIQKGENLHYFGSPVEGPAGNRTVAVLGDWLILSMGTDGIDGPTDAAGAWAGPETIRRAKDAGLNSSQFLRENDSYGFFMRAGGLIMTGPTGRNVMDIRIFLFIPALGK